MKFVSKVKRMGNKIHIIVPKAYWTEVYDLINRDVIVNVKDAMGDESEE